MKLIVDTFYGLILAASSIGILLIIYAFISYIFSWWDIYAGI